MTSREKFEAWVSDNGKFQRALECKGGIYLLATINTQWEAWQAASEASEQQLLDMSVQLANAESKCRELAAENGGLKAVESNLVRNIINDLGDTEFQYEKVKTPATDAFLAEVRASAIEELMEKSLWDTANCLSGIGAFYKANDRKAVHGIIRDELKERVTEFASQLRQGAAL